MRHSPVDPSAPFDASPHTSDPVSPPASVRVARAMRTRAEIAEPTLDTVAINGAATNAAVSGPKDIRALLGKQLVPLLMTLGIVALLWERAAQLDFPAILQTVATVRPWQWMLAILASAGSFWAVGHYDRVLHAQLGTGIAAKPARHTGMAAIGLSQFLGFGALTGTLIRWRMVPELSLWQAARLSAAVSLSFLAGWAVVAALAVLVFQPEIAGMTTLATGAIALAGLMVLISIFPPRFMARLPWPSLKTIGTVIGLAATDTILAGLALYALMPPELALALGQTVAAYLFSLGAGLIGNTPGGVGPFEATMAALLPSVDLASLFGAVLAFRLVYYALPATIAALFILRGPRGPHLAEEPRLMRPHHSPYLPLEIETQLFAAPRAEANLLRTRDFSLLTTPKGKALGLVAPIGQSLVMLSDPLIARQCPAATREALSRAAARRYRMPAIYKCGARMAASARAAGWAVLPTAEEAWLDPKAFTLAGAPYRQLRRILKKADAGRLRIEEAGLTLPLDQMDRVATEWKAQRGRERGFSMGTYDRDYISCQRVFLAWQGTNLVGFVSFHETQGEMTLDLMRSGDAAPDGTVQKLIVAAIAAARTDGIPRVSLAAVPWQGEDAHGLTAWIRGKLLARSGAQGLRRFKAAFAPNWEVLYLAAPGPVSLGIAGMDILRRITAPPPRATRNPMKAARFATHKTGHLRLWSRAEV